MKIIGSTTPVRFRPTRAWRLAAGLLAGLLAASAAAAQPQLGTRLEREPEPERRFDEGTETARRVLREFGQCVAERRREFAVRALSMPLMSEEQARFVTQSVGGEDRCLFRDGSMNLHHGLLLGAIAEHLIVQDYSEADVAAVAALTDERQAAIGLAPRTGYEDAAICAARADAPGIHALVRSRPGSDEEQTAFARVTPGLGPCMPAGQTLSFTRSSLRAVLATGLYRVLAGGGACGQCRRR